MAKCSNNRRRRKKAARKMQKWRDGRYIWILGDFFHTDANANGDSFFKKEFFFADILEGFQPKPDSLHHYYDFLRPNYHSHVDTIPEIALYKEVPFPATLEYTTEKLNKLFADIHKNMPNVEVLYGMYGDPV
jgi:hypothetical protein